MAFAPATARRDVQQEITDSIVRQIEAGAGTWRMPWHTKPGEGASCALPVNQDGKRYSGLNVVILWGAAMEKGFSRPIWGTFKNWEKLGAFPNKGEKASLIFFWDRILDKKHAAANPGAKPKYFFFCKAWNVFNIGQLQTVPAKFANPEPVAEIPEETRIAAADKFYNAIPATVKHGGNKAFYTAFADFIALPNFEQFKSPVDYYSTRGHESGHWTGHESRCNREFGKRFGDAAYAFEELVAELIAAFLCSHLGLSNEPRPDHAQYCASWLKVLKNDKTAIFTAGSKAGAGFNLLLSLSGEQSAEESDTEGEEMPLPMAA